MDAPKLVQTIAYILLGIVWVFPLMLLAVALVMLALAWYWPE